MDTGLDELSVNGRRVEIAVLIGLTLAAAALRFIDLGALPLGAAGTEEGTSWLVTAGQLKHGYPLLPSGLMYWKGLPYTLSAALVSLVFGLSAWSLRVPPALAGVAAVPIAWYAVRSGLRRLGLAGPPAAAASLFAAYLLAFSAWSVIMSRWGRFYEMGLTLFLAGAAVAVSGFGAPRLGARHAWAFGILAFVASATFHSGVILWIAPFAALLFGARVGPREMKILAGFLLATLAWFAGVLFFWKSGHVEAGSGWQDLLIMTGLPFWKHMLVLSLLGFGGWALIARRGARASKAAAGAIGLLVLLEAVIFVAAGVNGVDTGALRGFQLLATSHPGLMVLAAVGTVALVILTIPLPPEGRRAAGLMWVLTVLPIAMVGASTGNFVPRYLLFTFGPLAVASSMGIALFVARLGRFRQQLVAGVLLCAAAVGVAPTIGPAVAASMLTRGTGDPWPPLLACSPSRPYALDLESPSRFVAGQLTPDDLVVSTARSIPEAVIGRMDYFYRPPDPSNALFDEAGGPFNILTGCPMLQKPEDVLRLCADKRVFIIIDERALQVKRVRELRDALVRVTGGPDYAEVKYAEVFVLPRGCGAEPASAETAETAAR
jgi:hypothetical protein